MRIRFASACALAAVVCLFIPINSSSTVHAQPAPRMEVERDGVRITNLAPGAQVVLFSYAKYVKRETLFADAQARLLSDEDSDGVITLASDVPNASVWVAIDYETGGVATGALRGFALSVRPIAETLFRKDADEAIHGLEQVVPRLHVLLVRPGLGAWTLRVREGGDGDRDGEANGRIRLAFEDAQPIPGGKEKAPQNLKAGDIVVAVDPGRLNLFVSEVAK